MEDTLRACKGHDDGVKLLGDLHERLGEASGKLQVGSHDTQGDAADSQNREHAAAHRGQNELQVSHISDDGTHHTGKGMGGRGALKQPLVEPVKVLPLSFSRG